MAVTLTSSNSFFSHAYNLPKVSEWLPEVMPPKSSKRSLLNSVHVEELLELDATKLLHDDDREEADLHVIAWISFVEFSASIRVCVNVITKEQQHRAQQEKNCYKRNYYISTEKDGTTITRSIKFVSAFHSNVQNYETTHSNKS